MNQQIKRTAESFGIYYDSFYYETNSSGEVIELELYEPEYNRLTDEDRANHLRFATTFDKLESLEISFYDYEITDLSFLSGLKKLKYLSIDCNSQFFNLSGFLHLTELEMLHIQGSKLESIAGIELFHKLEYLSLGYSKIKDISLLAKLSATLKGIYLSDNQITDISCFAMLHQLEYFHVSKNYISEIPDLTDLTDLTEIMVDDNQISSLEGLSNLKKLTKLEASGNRLTNIDSLTNLPAIQELYLKNNLISDISCLSGLQTLVNLDISDNKIESLISVSSLKKLNFLSCNNNAIKDFDKTQLSSSIKFLYLNNCGIRDIRFLNRLAELNTLYLNDNHISEFSSFKNTGCLRYLSLENNNIAEPFSLNDYPNIHMVSLSGNTFGSKKFAVNPSDRSVGTIKELSAMSDHSTSDKVTHELDKGPSDFVFNKVRNEHHPFIKAVRIALLVFLIVMLIILVKAIGFGL
ncbi:leucine-rich repeat domain-containing protein [Chryseobacterium gallinarum]|uniref:leucine-rich repeat domain-containing protein n=1 Tax=Chryseobacterium gallinarum TaxID=1324352 RepID=UPI0020255123|nr:leucine-rich repeat domain-containing protein [Chryseobacterium gallinarum]MCL8536556.1 leucine-rich repeat domain-containing protein [Chryseobacterium gallinarum]